MSGNIRIKQFPELVSIRTPIDARSDLQVYSIAQTDSAISAAMSGVDLSVYTLLSTTEEISGSIISLQSDTASISGDLMSLSSSVDAISGDFLDLDLSLTQKITQDVMQSPGTSGASTTIVGYLDVSINGVSYKLGIVS